LNDVFHDLGSLNSVAQHSHIAIRKVAENLSKILDTNFACASAKKRLEQISPEPPEKFSAGLLYTETYRIQG
jgi:hypothetical protein